MKGTAKAVGLVSPGESSLGPVGAHTGRPRKPLTLAPGHHSTHPYVRWTKVGCSCWTPMAKPTMTDQSGVQPRQGRTTVTQLQPAGTIHSLPRIAPSPHRPQLPACRAGQGMGREEGGRPLGFRPLDLRFQGPAPPLLWRAGDKLGDTPSSPCPTGTHGQMEGRGSSFQAGA